MKDVAVVLQYAAVEDKIAGRGQSRADIRLQNAAADRRRAGISVGAGKLNKPLPVLIMPAEPEIAPDMTA